MKKLLIPISIIGLVLIVLGPVLFAAGRIELDMNKHIMLAGTILWFATAPFWMEHGQ
jgi:Na+/glutamate symporter